MGTVAEFRGSLAANHRRRQANDESTQTEPISYSHGSSKTLSDSRDSVKAGRSRWMTKALPGLAPDVFTNLAKTRDKPIGAEGGHRNADQHQGGMDEQKLAGIARGC